MDYLCYNFFFLFCGDFLSSIKKTLSFVHHVSLCRLLYVCSSGEHGYREEMEEERIEYLGETNCGTLTTTGLEHFKFIRIQEKELRRRETGKK